MEPVVLVAEDTQTVSEINAPVNEALRNSEFRSKRHSHERMD